MSCPTLATAARAAAGSPPGLTAPQRGRGIYSACSDRNPELRFAGTSCRRRDSNPDTRIRIPFDFGLATGNPGSVGHAVGHNGIRGARSSVASWRPRLETRSSTSAERAAGRSAEGWRGVHHGVRPQHPVHASAAEGRGRRSAARRCGRVSAVRSVGGATRAAGQESGSGPDLRARVSSVAGPTRSGSSTPLRSR